jgi:transcription elongation factor GreA
MKRVHLTREGYEKLAQELEHLKKVKRREISKSIEHARSLGDLRENAEYHAAKEAMAKNEARINDLEDKLSRAEIIDDTEIDSSKAYIGATVTLVDLESGDEVAYTLVSSDEANPAEGLISTTSPVGKALLGHGLGDEVTISVPAGDLKYKITKITR